jgi:rod shape-determining protein MreC
VHDKTIRRRRAVLALLVVVSLILLTDYFGESPSSPLHSLQRGVVAVLSPIQDGASKVLSPVRDVTNWVSTTLQAKSENKRLAAENAKYKKELALDGYDAIEYANDQKLLELDTTDNLQSYGLVGANVIARDPLLWYQYITIDKGRDDGVKDNDPVISQGGLVGDVLSAGASSSTVTLITDPKFAVGAMIETSGASSGVAGVSGVLEPEVGDPSTLQLSNLPPSSSAEVQTNQVVVTSGFADTNDPNIESYYPPGIPIGQISTQNPADSITTDQQVQVTPFVNLAQVRTVQVLTKPHAGA